MTRQSLFSEKKHNRQQQGMNTSGGGGDEEHKKDNFLELTRTFPYQLSFRQQTIISTSNNQDQFSVQSLV